MKLDFSKADGIVEVTRTCVMCAGEGRRRHGNHGWTICSQCEGRGKGVEFMTPQAIRSMLEEEEVDDEP